MLGHYKRILMIGAHPDDEDTELLTILVRGMGAEAAYLSLNRGEGDRISLDPSWARRSDFFALRNCLQRGGSMALGSTSLGRTISDTPRRWRRRGNTGPGIPS